MSVQRRVSPLRPCPRVPHSPERDISPELFTKTDQRPSLEAAGLVSFGGSEEDNDDSLSFSASEGQDWSGSTIDPAPHLSPAEVTAEVTPIGEYGKHRCRAYPCSRQGHRGAQPRLVFTRRAN